MFKGPLFLLLLSTSLAAQEAPAYVAKIVEEGTQRSMVMEHLDHLTNKIGPRLTGSQRLIQACEWARDRFRSFGIENARIEQWGEVAVGFDRGVHSGSAEWKGEDGTPVAKPLSFGTMAWTIGTEGKKSGPGLLAIGKDPAKELEGKVKGAWILVRGGASAELRKVCEEGGALGFVQRNRGELIITDGNMSTKWEGWGKLPQIRVVPDQWDEISKHAGSGGVTLHFDIQNHFKKGPVPLYNVLAEIKGTRFPDELVIVGGHIDSWDGATGTTDNGTGTATTIEIARLVAKSGVKPLRTIRFMLWSGEEQGLLGSREYIKKHPEDLAKVSAVLVHDGGTNYVSGIYGLEDQVPIFEKVFAPVLELDKEMPFKIRQVKSLPGFIGSDQDSYVAKGVPGFFWDQKGRANYTHTHHTQFDTFDAAIPEYQRHTSIVAAIGAIGIANWPTMLPRAKPASAPSQPNPAANRRRLGVQLDGDSLTIVSFVDDSRGKAAGLREGDQIVAVDGSKIASSDDLSTALNSGGNDKKITVLRGGKEVVVEIAFPPR